RQSPVEVLGLVADRAVKQEMVSHTVECGELLRPERLTGHLQPARAGQMERKQEFLQEEVFFKQDDSGQLSRGGGGGGGGEGVKRSEMSDTGRGEQRRKKRQDDQCQAKPNTSWFLISTATR
ncbi:unnamed protein product, partial [Pleuronectes platessa]